MSNSAAVVLVPSVGAIRPFRDFAGANLRVAAYVRFAVSIPEAPNAPYTIKTELEIVSKAEVEFLEADMSIPADQPAGVVAVAHLLFSNTSSFVLGTATTLNPVVLPQMAATTDLDFSTDLTAAQPTPPTMTPTLSFGDSPIFNAMVLDPMADGQRAQAINTVQMLSRYFGIMEELGRLRRGAVVVGEGGEAAAPDQARVAELERTLEANVTNFENGRKNLSGFLGRKYLVLTEDGFVPTQPMYTRLKEKAKNPNDKEKVEPTTPTLFSPSDMRTRVANFVEDYVKSSNAGTINADVQRFIKSEFEALTNAVSTRG